MLSREKLQKLYGKGLSIQEIADKMGWHYSQTRYWMIKYRIPRRSWSDAVYIKNNPTGDPFNIKKDLTKKELFLKGLGLGIYWGEGDKSDNGQIRISNTDPRLIKKFKEFLIKIYCVKRKKFKYSLIVFNDGNEREAIRFWTKRLKIKRSQLGKITKIPVRGKGTYKKKSQFGVFVCSFINTKLKAIILKELRDYTPM